MKKPYTHFDLPKQHLVGQHYVPARARQSDEIERRRSLPTGTILLEQQRDGLAIASHLVEHVEEYPDLKFASDMLAASGINSGWYSYAQQADVMRRRLILPELAIDATDWRETRGGLMTKVREGLAHAAELGTAYASAKANHHETKRQATLLGRQMGNVSLQLACVRLGNAPLALQAFEVQSAARDEALATLDLSRSIASEVGVNPSLAQLADADSPLSVYWRRHAPNGAFDALEQAREEHNYAA